MLIDVAIRIGRGRLERLLDDVLSSGLVDSAELITVVWITRPPSSQRWAQPPDATVAINVAVKNISQTEARNVIVRIEFTSASPGVVAPVRALGNIEPGGEQSATWVFRPSLLLAGETVSFAVTISAENLSEAVEVEADTS